MFVIGRVGGIPAELRHFSVGACEGGLSDISSINVKVISCVFPFSTSILYFGGGLFPIISPGEIEAVGIAGIEAYFIRPVRQVECQDHCQYVRRARWSV